jgi:PAS domain S-box-containing protein
MLLAHFAKNGARRRFTMRNMRSSHEIKAEIRARLGFVPALFEPAEATPALLESLWQQSVAAYHDNPFPRLFKERAAAWVALQSGSRYGLAYHCCELHGLGVSARDILALLHEAAAPAAQRLDEHAAVLAAWPEPIATWTWPTPGSPLERALLAAAGADVADPRLTEPVRAHLRRLLGPTGHGYWVALLGFLRTCGQWVLAHPELVPDRDEHVQKHMPALLAEEPALAPLLGPEAASAAPLPEAPSAAPLPEAPSAAPLADARAQRAARPEDILDSAPLAIIEIDRDGIIRFASTHTTRIFGHAPGELIGKPLEMLLPERLARGHEALLQGFFDAPSARTMGNARHVYGLHKDGTEILLEVGLAPISSPPSGAVATLVDIGERVRAPEALRRVSEARDRLSRMFSDAGGADVIYNEILDLLLEIFESEFGFVGYIDEQGNLVCPSMTRHVWDACQVADKAIVFPRHTWKGLFGRVLLEKRCLIKNELHTLPEGHLPLYRSIGAPLIYRGELIGSLHLANRAWDYDQIDAQVLQAIADQVAPLLAARRAEDELRRSNADLEHFASVTSHDLQEPLRTVASFAELLDARYGQLLDERGAQYLRAIRDGATRMQQLVRDMLSVARPGSAKRAAGHTSCSEIVDNIIADLHASVVECNARITRAELPDLPIERAQLTQLFKNLLSNALKFRGDQPPQIHVSAQRSGSDWLFSVADNGIGIAPEHATKVFVMFQRVHDRTRYPGSGIGLAVAKRIVERHGGRIWFESEPGQGTTFFFALPVQFG